MSRKKILIYGRRAGKSIFQNKQWQEYLKEKKEKSEVEFKKEYMCIFDDAEAPHRKTVCGECKFFINKCTTSRLEAKYGSAGTPSCEEFEKIEEMRK